MGKKVALHNLGCKVNAYEVEAMQQLLEEAGYEIVPFEPGADVYLINTCTVTNIADRKSRQMLHKAKKMNPDAIVVAAGCYVQTDEGKLDKDEAVDLILGNNQKGNIVQVLGNMSNSTPNRNMCSRSTRQKNMKNWQLIIQQSMYAHISKFRTAVISSVLTVSFLMQEVVSEAVRSQHVLDEVHALAAKGYKEVVLTGIHLSSYGVDFPEERKKHCFP